MRVQWLRWPHERSGRDPVERLRESFLPREWDLYFGELMPEQRRAASVRLCLKVLAAASLDGEVIEQAIRALADGQTNQGLVAAVRAIVEQSEGEYDSLVGDDESKLSCADPVIADAFVRARAATALKCALEGDLPAMAYEAYFVLNDLDEVRRLVGIPTPHQ